MLSSGTAETDGISAIGISNSVVPTLRGPRYGGSDGNGLMFASIVVAMPEQEIVARRRIKATVLY